ncbi:hypothetical protein ACH4TP_23620 [Streptomyces sp. NPDC021012]|uniref:hypothetical protein n=1 Tax=Streptomyces sp. NPDC021012 TaxID=3365107 RepID=UPI0037A0CBCA
MLGAEEELGHGPEIVGGAGRTFRLAQDIGDIAISAAPQLTRNPRFNNGPGIVEKALAICNGTYP